MCTTSFIIWTVCSHSVERETVKCRSAKGKGTIKKLFTKDCRKDKTLILTPGFCPWCNQHYGGAYMRGEREHPVTIRSERFLSNYWACRNLEMLGVSVAEDTCAILDAEYDPEVPYPELEGPSWELTKLTSAVMEVGPTVATLTRSEDLAMIASGNNPREMAELLNEAIRETWIWAETGEDDFGLGPPRQ